MGTMLTMVRRYIYTKDEYNCAIQGACVLTEISLSSLSLSLSLSFSQGLKALSMIQADGMMHASCLSVRRHDSAAARNSQFIDMVKILRVRFSL